MLVYTNINFGTQGASEEVKKVMYVGAVLVLMKLQPVKLLAVAVGLEK